MKFSNPFSLSRNTQAPATQQQYQQEFWKLKAQRLQAKNDELSKQNQVLLKKTIDASKREQELIHKLTTHSSLDRSRNKNNDKDKPIAETERGARDEIERLGKELLVLKNEHTLELAKVTEENKRLRKKLGEIEVKQLGSVSAEEHNNKIRALTEEQTTLSKRLAASEQQIQRLRQEKTKILADNDALTKELNKLIAREKAAQKQEEEKLIDFRKYERLINQHKTQKQITLETQLEGIETNDFASQMPLEIAAEIDSLRKEIILLQNERQTNRKTLFEAATWQNQKTRLEGKMKQMQGEVFEAKNELKNVLSRLAPLLGQRQEFKGKENVEAKASLTLLQVFLKKYKIQAF